MALVQTDKQKIIAKFAQAKGDTGSPEVQVALLSEEIDRLAKHLADNKQDKPGKRGLLTKIAKRRRLMRYLAEHAKDRYTKLIKELGLKK